MVAFFSWRGKGRQGLSWRNGLAGISNELKKTHDHPEMALRNLDQKPGEACRE
jgi:hypothetical protein